MGDLRRVRQLPEAVQVILRQADACRNIERTEQLVATLA
jgi:hypothetical protein